MMEWQPISTAPKDGTRVRLGWWSEHYTKLSWETSVGYYEKSLFGGHWKNERPYEASHWMHLPAPPKEPTP